METLDERDPIWRYKWQEAIEFLKDSNWGMWQTVKPFAFGWDCDECGLVLMNIEYGAFIPTVVQHYRDCHAEKYALLVLKFT